ncbi:MAG: glycoside hydrolase family 16 protein [Kiritimatiellae bacterium]|nr:glycoside hydrolase family 16 protein [Kiritimatiellia bacterium]
MSILNYTGWDGNPYGVRLDREGLYFMRAENGNWDAAVRSTVFTIRDHDQRIWAIALPEWRDRIPGVGYVQVWSDEFSGPAIDPQNWIVRTGRGPNKNGWGNGEKQYYTKRSKNVRIEDGNLVIEAHAEIYNGCGYTSARLETLNRVPVRYGVIEAHIKGPDHPTRGRDNGTWPAFWIMGVNYPRRGWPACGELDIWEAGGLNPNTCFGASHWKTKKGTGDYQLETTLSDGLDQEYHTYAINWNSNRITWYVDHSPYGEFLHEEIPEGSPFNKDFFLLINLAIGGHWDHVGEPNPGNYPQRMYVDWIRVWTPGL